MTQKKDFLNRTAKAQALRTKLIKWPHETEKLLYDKEKHHSDKTADYRRENIYTSYTSNRELKL